ncbi:restriction endonuclease [Escherichia coli]|nr:restriction endonuclease [Escherichia coli]EER9415711.1 restriction endonuclease [Escherichia coli]EES1698326.1 restriction endonuclease [Escherichia coli]EES4298919.1 restriction endonuclease [Escherichia coli]EES9591467.1 restriction endonuclease [Escherichia coli]
MDASCNRNAWLSLEEMFPVMEDGKYVDKWAIRTTAMIARELDKQNNKAA